MRHFAFDRIFLPIASSGHQYAYDRFFDKYFTLLSYNQESFAQGNSAALKVVDNQTRLNLTLSRKAHNSIFSIGTALNISDNTGTLFSNNKPAAGTQFSFTYSYLFGHQTGLRYNVDTRNSLLSKRKQFWDSVDAYYSIEYPARASVVVAQLEAAREEVIYIQRLIVNAGNDRAAALAYKQQLVAALTKRDSLIKVLAGIDFSPKASSTKRKEILEAADEAMVKMENDDVQVTGPQNGR